VVEGGHLIEHTAERPDIRFMVIGLVLENLRGHVVRGANAGSSKVLGSFHDLLGLFGCGCGCGLGWGFRVWIGAGVFF